MATMILRGLCFYMIAAITKADIGEIGCRYNVPPGYSTCYYLSTDKETWDDANVTCSNINGTLAAIKDQETQDFINDNIVNTDGYTRNIRPWIGARTIRFEEWRWLDESGLGGFSRWVSNYPQIDMGGYVFASKSEDYLWKNDALSGSGLMSYICEVPVGVCRNNSMYLTIMHQSRCFYAFYAGSTIDWSEARHKCTLDQGGALAKVDSEPVFKSIQSALNAANSSFDEGLAGLFIGLHIEEWLWSYDQSLLFFDNWETFYPTASGGCIYMRYACFEPCPNFLWRNDNCSLIHEAVCEVIKEIPTSTASISTLSDVSTAINNGTTTTTTGGSTISRGSNQPQSTTISSSKNTGEPVTLTSTESSTQPEGFSQTSVTTLSNPALGTETNHSQANTITPATPESRTGSSVSSQSVSTVTKDPTGDGTTSNLTVTSTVSIPLTTFSTLTKGFQTATSTTSTSDASTEEIFSTIINEATSDTVMSFSVEETSLRTGVTDAELSSISDATNQYEESSTETENTRNPSLATSSTTDLSNTTRGTSISSPPVGTATTVSTVDNQTLTTLSTVGSQTYSTFSTADSSNGGDSSSTTVSPGPSVTSPSGVTGSPGDKGSTTIVSREPDTATATSTRSNTATATSVSKETITSSSVKANTATGTTSSKEPETETTTRNTGSSTSVMQGTASTISKVSQGAETYSTISSTRETRSTVSDTTPTTLNYTISSVSLPDNTKGTASTISSTTAMKPTGSSTTRPDALTDTATSTRNSGSSTTSGQVSQRTGTSNTRTESTNPSFSGGISDSTTDGGGGGGNLNALSAGEIAGITVGCVAGVALIILLIVCFCRSCTKERDTASITEFKDMNQQYKTNGDVINEDYAFANPVYNADQRSLAGSEISPVITDVDMNPIYATPIKPAFNNNKQDFFDVDSKLNAKPNGVPVAVIKTTDVPVTQEPDEDIHSLPGTEFVQVFDDDDTEDERDIKAPNRTILAVRADPSEGPESPEVDRVEDASKFVTTIVLP